ncbi:Gypsy retrotransposon integrase-like protein 1, partial [Mucuna pruriens]
MIQEALNQPTIEKLNKRDFSFPLLKCLGEDEAEQPIKEVHDGARGSDIGGRTLPSKITRVGFYWPTIKGDNITFVKKCDKCQRAPRTTSFNDILVTILHVGSGYLRLDILGPFPLVIDQVKFLIVVVDYFTKWIEVEPVATILAERVRRFYWRKIVCRFGLPTVISVEHAQKNNQAEAANKVILKGLRK